MDYTELKKVAKIIDTYTFIQVNKKIGCFDYCPETPEYTTYDEPPRIDEPKENKDRIDKIIKDFCNKKGS